MSNGQFFDMNAQQGRPSPPSSRPIRRAPSAPEPTAAMPPERKAEPVAAKRKKRAKVGADTRAVAVARVEKLIGAGNPAGKAVASVAKELGVSDSAVMNWRTAANHAKNHAAKKAAKKPAEKKRASKKTSEAVAGFAPNTPMPASIVGEHFIELIQDAVGPIVRAIVREEIRRMLS